MTSMTAVSIESSFLTSPITELSLFIYGSSTALPLSRRESNNKALIANIKRFSMLSVVVHAIGNEYLLRSISAALVEISECGNYE